jgi:hypothetical protein
MNHQNQKPISPKTLARIGGLLYLGIIACGLFTELYVRGSLVVPGEPAATATNIMANDGLFRLGFVSDLFMLVFDLSLALILFQLLKPVSTTLALAAALTRLAMDATLGLNLLNHFNALLLLSSAEYLQAFSTDQLHALISLSFEAHAVGYAIGLIFFAFHCLVLAYLVYRSDLFPTIFSPLLAAAFLSYLIDSSAIFLIPGYDTADYPYVMLPALIAEVALCLWLIIKGVKIPKTLSQKDHAPLASSHSAA